MAFLEQQSDDLLELLKVSPKTLVMYGAGWCGNCKLLKPKFKKMAESNVDIPFIYVDADKFVNSRNLTKLENLPTIVAFKGTENVGQDVGNKITVVEKVLENLK